MYISVHSNFLSTFSIGWFSLAPMSHSHFLFFSSPTPSLRHTTRSCQTANPSLPREKQVGLVCMLIFLYLSRQCQLVARFPGLSRTDFLIRELQVKATRDSLNRPEMKIILSMHISTHSNFSSVGWFSLVPMSHSHFLFQSCVICCCKNAKMVNFHTFLVSVQAPMHSNFPYVWWFSSMPLSHSHFFSGPALHDSFKSALICQPSYFSFVRAYLGILTFLLFDGFHWCPCGIRTLVFSLRPCSLLDIRHTDRKSASNGSNSE